MLIDGKNEVYMIDRDNSVFHVSNLEFPFRKDLRVHLTNTLLDGVSMYYGRLYIIGGEHSVFGPSRGLKPPVYDLLFCLMVKETAKCAIAI